MLGVLAAPVVLGQLGMFAMGLVDVLMVAPLGAVPLAGCESWAYVVLWMPSLALGGFGRL